MKSVDQDFKRYGSTSLFWTWTYLIVGLGSMSMLTKIWYEVSLHGMPFHTLIQIIGLPLIYIFPLILSLRIRRYSRCALKENLVSERVANNYEFFIGRLLLMVYAAITQFAILEWFSISGS